MKKNFKIEGMSCTACAAAIERTVNKMDGVEDAVVNYATENLTVTYNDSSVQPPAIVSAIEKSVMARCPSRKLLRPVKALSGTPPVKMPKSK